jgi:hypothetical protein
MTTSDILVETLIDWGATNVFGIVGDGINLIEALRKRQDRIRRGGHLHGVRMGQTYRRPRRSRCIETQPAFSYATLTSPRSWTFPVLQAAFTGSDARETSGSHCRDRFMARIAV